MSARLEVRSARPADFAAWQVLWDGYNAFYGRIGAKALAPALTQLTWSRFQDPAEPMYALLAERAGQLQGIAHFLYHRSTSQEASVCYLQDLFTQPAARRTGVARALIDALYAHARRAGSTRVYWQTHESNAEAMRLYDQIAQRSGFLVYRANL